MTPKKYALICIAFGVKKIKNLGVDEIRLTVYMPTSRFAFLIDTKMVFQQL